MLMYRRRPIWLVMFLAALGIAVVVAAWQINAANKVSSGLPKEILEVIPAENSQILRQQTVGIEFKGLDSYIVQLWLNEEPLPEDEVQSSSTRFTYNPSEGLSVEELVVGENCVRARYRLVTQSVENARSYRWCFQAN